ncbi:hypothetical protein ACJ73_02719 [Blastomyces percursus]|uniref:Uncharacterized protein n=1 Tax=Blastomyces percursus TaxID=1658174 RepID=A0A1J9QAN9_9EURO|nr:hypothetical protein ACJ73_02719 [Blastomyces percursus]
MSFCVMLETSHPLETDQADLDFPLQPSGPPSLVQDDDYAAAIEKFVNAGFSQRVPNRTPPEIIEEHPDPQQMLKEINANYKRLDQSCAVFDDQAEKGLQVYLYPNSFAHLSLKDISHPSNNIGYTVITEQFDVYNNLQYPLEQALVESFVKAAIDEERDVGFSAWGETLRSWVSLMTRYLEVENDVLDHCSDKQAVEWYSTNFGRIHEANSGPIDRRISKRLGFVKELPIDEGKCYLTLIFI